MTIDFNALLNKRYAGIGSRETPAIIEPVIKAVAEVCNADWYTLRSGGAQGADTMFERYANKVEIFLPWKGFNDNPSRFCEPSRRAFEIAEKHHPAWHRLSDGSCRLHARNVHQILGKDCESPVQFVVCWTKDGQDSGGTGQALRIARAHGILVSNLFFPAQVEFWMTKRMKIGLKRGELRLDDVRCPECNCEAAKACPSGYICEKGHGF